MKNRHMEGEDHPLTLDEILDETNQLDISGATKQWLTLEALGKIQTLHLKSIKLIVCVAYRINTYVLYMTERTSNRFRIDKIVLLGVLLGLCLTIDSLCLSSIPLMLLGYRYPDVRDFGLVFVYVYEQ